MQALGVKYARQGGVTLFFGKYVFILCCLGSAVYSWALNCVMFMTAQGHMLDLLDDMTSTVSFCQLSGGVLPVNLYA